MPGSSAGGSGTLAAQNAAAAAAGNLGRGNQTPEALAAAALLPPNAIATQNALAANIGARGRGAPALTSANAAPAKATAAPNANTITVFTGLCDALNQFQQDLKNSGTYEIADVYEVQFATPPDIGQEQVIIPGTVSYKSTGMANKKTPNAQTNTDTDNVQTISRIIQARAGTQIVQFMDQVIRNSTYITKQANVTINEQGVATKTANNSTQTSGFMWYKINFQIQNLGYDSKRNDFAYKMIFIISQYPVTDISSQFFSPGAFRGVHKSYSYWFTGTNSQVLSFEQDYNNLYYQILMSPPDGIATAGGAATGAAIPAGLSNPTQSNTSNIPNVSKGFAAGSQQSSQGADNGAGLIGASAADWLYSITNRGSITLKIVGDPAWLQQDEVTNTLTADGFSWAPFNKDGGINYDASSILFDISFNRPGDYNFDTGLVEVTAPSTNPQTGAPNLLQPQAHLVYTAISVTSTFSQGKFEQELHGKAYLGNFMSAAATGRQASATGVAPGSRTANNNAGFYSDGEYESDTSTQYDPSSNPAPTVTDNTSSTSQPAPQPASPASDPTSNGDVSSNSTSPAPQNASISDPVVANAEETAAVNAYVAAGGTFPRGTGPITSGPLFDGVVAAKASLTARQQAAASVSTTSSPPQTMAPKDA